MKLLLDTQVGLWWLVGDRRLSKNVRSEMEAAECFISVVSIWEVAIKHRIGKLPVAPQTFRDAMAKSGARIVAITEEHVIREASLEIPHGDPFDRLLIAVAVVEQMALLTADARLQALNAVGLIKPI